MGARQSQTRHVYNNCGRDIQLYLVAACIEPESSRVQSESAVDDDLSLSKQALIGMLVCTPASRTCFQGRFFRDRLSQSRSRDPCEGS